MNITALFGQAYYDPYYTSTTSGNEALQAGALLSLSLFIFLVAIAVYVVQALLLSRIFSKAGVETWKAWVPIYSNWVMLELGGQQGFWAVLMLVPVVNIVSAVFMFIAMYYIGLKLGKQGAFVLLAIFLPAVWLVWLAVDNSTWEGRPAKKSRKKAAAKK
jgi:hypothetical protein